MVLDQILGFKAVLQVASVESNNPLPGAVSMALVEGSEGQAMDPRFNSPNNTKVRSKTPNSATPRLVLTAVPSILTNVANNIGNK